MTARKGPEPLVRVCHRIWDEDKLRLESLARETNFYKDEIMREIVHKFLARPKAAILNDLLRFNMRTRENAKA